MNLNSLITAPARLGLGLGRRIVGLLQDGLGGRQVDDETIQQQVEDDIFSSRRASTSKVEVEVVEGVVWLRGEVRSASALEEIESLSGAIEGVKRVENLLRVAKTTRKPKAPKRPAPARSARPQPAAATAPPPAAEPAEPAGPAPAEPAPAPSPAAQEERPVTRRFTAEQTPAEAEPSPAELAERGEGRRPAPFGATSPTGEGGSPPAPFPSGVANRTGGDDDSDS